MFKNWPWWGTVTFLVYTLVWDCGIFAAFLYYVLVLHHSMWWLLLASILASTSYKPRHWRQLFDPNAPSTKEDRQ